MNQVQRVNCRIEFRIIVELVRFIASPIFNTPSWKAENVPHRLE